MVIMSIFKMVHYTERLENIAVIKKFYEDK